MAGVVYPESFLSRPCDRMFVGALAADGVDVYRARWICYQVWRDFATGGSDRRIISGADFAEDRVVFVLESFCEWGGPRGKLVDAAVDAGFLQVENTPGGGRVLICVDFYPSNSSWNSKGNSMQRRGAFTRVLRKDQEKSEAAVKEREELWSRTGGGVCKDMDPALRRRGLLFVNRVCRALRMDPPTDALLAAGDVIGMAARCAAADAEVVDRTLLWMLSNRDGQEIPGRIDAVLREWDKFVEAASRELA